MIGGCPDTYLGSPSPPSVETLTLEYNARSAQSIKMTKIIDDKSQYCVPFILDRLCLHESKHKDKHESEIPPLFLGINGVQGAGKTVLVRLPTHQTDNFTLHNESNPNQTK